MGLLGEFEHIDDDMMVTISKQMLRELVEEGVNKQLAEIQYRLENFIQRQMYTHSDDIAELKVNVKILESQVGHAINTLVEWEPTIYTLMHEVLKNCPPTPTKVS